MPLTRTRLRIGFFLFAIICLSCGCQTVEQEPFQTSVDHLKKAADVKVVMTALARPLINAKRNYGMVIAVVTKSQEVIEAYGTEDGKKPMQKNARFEIGSISKSFTSLLASRYMDLGALKIDDPVKKYFPRRFPISAVKSPDLLEITFAQLADHTSGLPHEDYSGDTLWGVISYLFTGENLYRFHTKEKLEAWLREYSFTTPQKHEYAYSNLGAVYLGWLLGEMNGKGYWQNLRTEILSPLGMSETGLCLKGQENPGLVVGHAGDLPTFYPRNAEVEPWYFEEALSGTGGLYSTAADLLTYVKAQMGILKTPLYSAMQRQQMPRTETGEGHIGLSWYIETLPETKKKFLHIDGIVGGYTSFIGFDQEKNFGVVVLQNSINHDDMIGVTLLDRLVAAHQTKSRHQASK